MKKLALLCFTALAANTVSAQTVQFGLRGGLNISRESSHEYSFYISDGMKNKAGLHIGGVAEFSLSDRFAIEADVLYSMQGYKDVVYTEAVEQNISNTDYTVTSHYINIPVSAKYYITDGLYVECGPQVGFLLSKRDELENWEIENSYNSDTTKKVDFGVLGGIGYKFPNNVFISGRYIHSFTGTSKLYDGAKNRDIQISLGYMF